MQRVDMMMRSSGNDDDKDNDDDSTRSWVKAFQSSTQLYTHTHTYSCSLFGFGLEKKFAVRMMERWNEKSQNEFFDN